MKVVDIIARVDDGYWIGEVTSKPENINTIPDDPNDRNQGFGFKGFWVCWGEAKNARPTESENMGSSTGWRLANKQEQEKLIRLKERFGK